MQESGLVTLVESFAGMPDPKVAGRTDHRLLDIRVLTVCAVLCGADDWEGVEMWGQARLAWLRQFIALENGIPSRDTIGRVFAAMDSAKFQGCFTRRESTLCASLVGQEVAIDGKTQRGPASSPSGQKGHSLG